MKTKKEIQKELRNVLEKTENSKSYSQRNSNIGYLKGLLFCLGMDISGRLNFESVEKLAKIHFSFDQRYRIGKKAKEVFELWKKR